MKKFTKLGKKNIYETFTTEFLQYSSVTWENCLLICQLDLCHFKHFKDFSEIA